MCLILVVVLISAGAAWRPRPLDSRLVGEWNFLTTDGTNIRRFLTLQANGTVAFEQEQPGQTTRLPLSGPMDWWMEGDVVVFEQRWPIAQKASHLVQDVSAMAKGQKRPDRADFRLKLLERNPGRLRIREVSAGIRPSVEIELIRSESTPRPQ
jgi:hypothetical protein